MAPKIQPASWDEIPRRKHPGGRPSDNPFIVPVEELTRSMPRDAAGTPIARSEGLRKVVIKNDPEVIRKHIRWLYTAGNKFNVTVRNELAYPDFNPDDWARMPEMAKREVEKTSKEVVIYFWTAPRIHREKKKK